MLPALAKAKQVQAAEKTAESVAAIERDFRGLCVRLERLESEQSEIKSMLVDVKNALSARDADSSKNPGRR